MLLQVCGLCVDTENEAANFKVIAFDTEVATFITF